MRVAVPLVLQEDLATSQKVIPALVESDSNVYSAGLPSVLQTTIENRQGRIRMEAVVRNTSTQRNRQVIQIESASGNLLGPLNALAKRLDSHATDFSTNNDSALKAFTEAAEANQLSARMQMLNNAIAADPAFGLAYIVLAQTLSQSRQDATPLLARAAAHRSAFTAFDRARWNALASRLAHAPVTQQEQTARAVLQLAPNDVDALAALGSERFLTGDAATAERLLRRALALNPGNINIQRQLAEGLFEARQFADAERVFVNLDNNPAILPELAVCVLLEGDSARADSVFNRFLSLRPANDPLSALLRGTWLALSGRRTEAISFLSGEKLINPAYRSIALSQIAIWQMLSGNTAEAKKDAAAAAQLDNRPNSMADIAVLMTSENGPADGWKNRVNALELTAQVKQSILGYGLFLNGHYPEAAEIWQEIVQRSGGADLRARTMLAASLDRAGRTNEARKILVQPFIPELGDLYAAVSFTEMRRLLGLQVH